jgi:GPH family glycoside/pentoside/hexuronide:cation symporter
MTAATATHATATQARAVRNLSGYALFAGLLAMAGLPIYIHAPKFYVDEYGVSLAALGTALFLLRMLDFVQDPALGWLAGATRRRRGAAVALASAVMALAMVGLFAVTPPIEPLWWFALTLTALFSAFSFLTISFYAQGVQKAEAMGADGHVRLAAWRETGSLLGVCLAAAAPTGLMLVVDAPFTAFAAGFVAAALAAVLAMRAEWGAGAKIAQDTGFRAVLGDALARRLLLIALLNAMPVAVTSTLFLFFVESRLQLPGWEGPLLLLFFLSAAVAAPLWGRLAAAYGARRMLLVGMVLAIVTFAFAATLGPGDGIAFAVICVASGAALGADLTLLSAIFARRMARIAPEAGAAFGLWAFVTKATLAIAAIVILPLLDRAGFSAGADNPEDALYLLTIFYAIVPCGLKLGAIALLALTPVEET